MKKQKKQLWTSNFRQLKEERRMTFREISKLTGASVSALQKVRDGGNVELDLIIRICRAFGCCLDDLVKIVPQDDYNHRTEVLERMPDFVKIAVEG